MAAAFAIAVCASVSPASAASHPNSSATASQSPTVVSLTFDDGYVTDWSKALPILDKYGMHGTFYVNSGTIGQDSDKLTWDDLADLQAHGNEIGGHSTYHPDFRNLDLDEVQRQICDDRVTLMNHGLRVTDFAYPYGHGSNDQTIQEAVRDCGYNSARRAGGLASVSQCGSKNPCAEQIPPPNPYAIRVPAASLKPKLDWLESRVQAAEANGGGWVVLTFHKVCDTCVALDSFLAWLQNQEQSGTVVETVSEVIGGDLAPPVQGPAPPPRSGNLLRNPSLEAVAPYPGGNTLVAECWNGRQGQHGTVAKTWERTTDAHSDSYAERLTLTSVGKGARDAIMTTHDLGMCSIPTNGDATYEVSAWYHSDAPVLFAVDYQIDNLDWLPLAVSPTFSASTDWTEATWSFDVPAETTEIGVGLGLNQVGSVTMDDFSLVDVGSLTDP